MGRSKAAVKRRSKKRKEIKRIKHKLHTSQKIAPSAISEYESVGSETEYNSDIVQSDLVTCTEIETYIEPCKTISAPAKVLDWIANGMDNCTSDVDKTVIPNNTVNDTNVADSEHNKNDPYYLYVVNDPLAVNFAKWRTLKLKTALLEKKPIGNCYY